MRGGLARALAYGLIRWLPAVKEDRGCRRICPEEAKVVRMDSVALSHDNKLVKDIFKRLLVFVSSSFLD